MDYFMQDEIIDLVDTTNKIIGQIGKNESHKSAKWHRTVSFILVDSKRKLIYFQDKAKVSELNSEDFFVKLNGGHLLSGETPEQGIRELEEELGIKVHPDKLIPMGIDQTAVDFSDKYKIREFMYYFIVDVEDVLNKVKFQDSEVSSLIYFDPEHALKLILGAAKEMTGIVYDGEKELEVTLKPTAFKNFTDDNLYLRIFLAVKRYFAGEPPEYIII